MYTLQNQDSVHIQQAVLWQQHMLCRGLIHHDVKSLAHILAMIMQLDLQQHFVQEATCMLWICNCHGTCPWFGVHSCMPAPTNQGETGDATVELLEARCNSAIITSYWLRNQVYQGRR